MNFSLDLRRHRFHVLLPNGPTIGHFTNERMAETAATVEMRRESGGSIRERKLSGAQIVDNQTGLTVWENNNWLWHPDSAPPAVAVIR